MAVEYKIPYTFQSGTKANPDEVNANFKYLIDSLGGVTASRNPFCINIANKNSAENPDLFSYEADKLLPKIGGAYADLIYTSADGTSVSMTSAEAVSVLSTKYESIFPTMISNEMDSISIATSSEDSNHPGWFACDKNADSYYASFIGTTTASLSVHILERKIAKFYRLKTLTAASWKLEASNDFHDWIILDEYATSEASEITRLLEVPGNYNTYKVTVSAISGMFQVQIAEFDMFEESATGTVTLDEIQNIYIDSTGLECLNNKCFRQEKKPVGVKTYDSIIPKMESNLVPDGYVVTASSQTAVNAAYLAMDRENGSYWEASESEDTTWIQIQIPNPLIAKACKLTVGSSLEKSITSGRILGSNNGSTWAELRVITDLVWNYEGETKYLYFDGNNERYTYYRLEGAAPFTTLSEFQLFSESTNGEYLLGEAQSGDIWFNLLDSSMQYVNGNWESYSKVPAGAVSVSSEGKITAVSTLPYNQNGASISSVTSKENAGNIVTYDSYTSHLGAPGYVILPNNLIIQWGTARSWEDCKFPITFPHKLLSIVASAQTQSGAVGATISKSSNSGFTIHNSIYTDVEAPQELDNYWIGIGW